MITTQFEKKPAITLGVTIYNMLQVALDPAVFVLVASGDMLVSGIALSAAEGFLINLNWRVLLMPIEPLPVSSSLLISVSIERHNVTHYDFPLFYLSIHDCLRI